MTVAARRQDLAQPGAESIKQCSPLPASRSRGGMGDRNPEFQQAVKSPERAVLS